MKGYVTLTESDIDLFSKAIEVIDNSTPEYITDYEYVAEYEYEWGRKIKYKERSLSPSWYRARNDIKRELYNLISFLWKGKDVKLWLDSYNEIVKLSNGDINAQPNVILNESGWW